MTTNTTTPATPAALPAATAGQRRKLRLLGLLAIFVGLFAPAVALAEPAAAAGSQSTGVYFCAPYANAQVQLQIWNGSKFVHYKWGTSGANGCGTFRYVDGGYYYKVAQAVRRDYCSSWVYGTAWKPVYGGSVVNVGGMSYEGLNRVC